jgi:hypothetical protein
VRPPSRCPIHDRPQRRCGRLRPILSLATELRECGVSTANGGARWGDNDHEITAGPQWPAPLAPEAFYGLAGQWVILVKLETEADPVVLDEAKGTPEVHGKGGVVN